MDCAGIERGGFHWCTSSTDMAIRHDHSVKCVAVSSEGNLVAAGSYDGNVALLDWRRGEWVHSERVSAFGVSCVTPAGHGDAFLASSYDGRVYAVATAG